MIPAAPWRDVVDGHQDYQSATLNVMNRANGRESRWWELILSCGHIVDRAVRYTPSTGPYRAAQRKSDDMLPAPTRVRCERCAVDCPEC